MPRIIRYTGSMSRVLNRRETTGGIEITDRDEVWLRAIHRYRFITTDQAQLLSEGRITKRREAVNKRLRCLLDHNYIDRPALQKEVFSRGDKRHVVNALGQAGAKWLSEHAGVSFPAGKGWKSANAALSSKTKLLHDIGAVDTVLRFDRTIKPLPDLRMLHQDELMAQLNDWPRRLRPHWLPTQVWRKGELVDRHTNPDYTFSLAKLVEGRERKALFFLEYDNDTEDYDKSNALASGIGQKHICYNDAYERKLPLELYGIKGLNQTGFIGEV